MSINSDVVAPLWDISPTDPSRSGSWGGIAVSGLRSAMLANPRLLGPKKRTPAARDIISYWGALVLMAGTLAVVYALLRSRRGLALGAIRDQEAAAAGLGVDIYRTKLAVYVAAAAMTGMIGALIYLQKARISPDAAFSVLDWTAYVIFIVVIGGIGTMEGPVIGAVIFYLLQRYLADFGAWYLILLGTLAIAVMLFAPRGLWGFVTERFGVTLFPTRRRLVIDADEIKGG